jgi:SagB-type dehydrogenase family enzyme
VDPSWVLSLPEDVTVAVESDGGLTLSNSRACLTLRRLAPELRDALYLLRASGDGAGRLAGHLRTVSGPEGLARWYYYLQRLAERQLLRFSAYAGEERLATLEPIASTFVLPPAGVSGTRAYVLSRFAWTYRRDGGIVLESPLSCARVVLHDQRAAAFVHALSRPGTAAEIGDRLPGLPAEAVRPLLGLLVHADMACAIGDDGTTAEDSDPALRCWEFHDLLFHARSREGRHDAPLGATYRLAGRLEPPPAVREPRTTEMIDLYRPDLQQLQREDPPFARVQEQRRSIRQYGAEPISDRQVGEFLYRVARVRERREVEVETPAGSVSMDFASRPYPGGGSLYELEVYAVVNICQGLRSGLYHYDPLRHRLGCLAGRTAAVERLLSTAALSAGVPPDRPQVLLILAARLPRIAWKYTGLAYALVLKDVGVVFQTMYLAATAMGLAPCAIGAGDSDLFARAAGINYYAETSVGEFLLGSGSCSEGDGERTQS